MFLISLGLIIAITLLAISKISTAYKQGYNEGWRDAKLTFESLLKNSEPDRVGNGRLNEHT